jgi:hypothetical protein
MQADISADSKFDIPESGIPLQVAADVNGPQLVFAIKEDMYKNLLITDPDFVKSFIPAPAKKADMGISIKKTS